MSKGKDFGSVAEALQGVAEETPSIHRTPREIKKGEGGDKQPPAKAPAIDIEPIVSFPLKMRESLRDELAQQATAGGMTMRGFVMQALRDAGLSVTDSDLVDRRKR